MPFIHGSDRLMTDRDKCEVAGFRIRAAAGYCKVANRLNSARNAALLCKLTRYSGFPVAAPMRGVLPEREVTLSNGDAITCEE